MLEHLLAVLGVHHLGVPLHAGHAAGRAYSNAATGVTSVEASTVKPSGRRGHRVAVGHPDGVLGRDVGEQGAGVGHA